MNFPTFLPPAYLARLRGAELELAACQPHEVDAHVADGYIRLESFSFIETPDVQRERQARFRRPIDPPPPSLTETHDA